MIVTRPYHYKGLEEIVNFALCTFVKAPIETIVESVGSVINKHGKKERSSMKPRNLSDEIFVSWNGPPEHSVAARKLLNNSLNSYFKGNPRFYKNNKRSANFSSTSSSVGKMLLKQRPKIQF